MLRDCLAQSSPMSTQPDLTEEPFTETEAKRKGQEEAFKEKLGLELWVLLGH